MPIRRARPPAWFDVLCVVLAVLSIWRGVALIEHRPLLAFANNYDQIRYTACLDLAPWRPGVNADVGNPQAPLSRFAFQPLPRGSCVWSSDLLFTAPVAAAWRLSEAIGGRSIHSVRRLGEWRLLCVLLVAGWATLALRRAGRPDLAAAHLAWLALFGLDPANTLYFSTFYAEAAAIIGFYVTCAGVAVALVRPTRVALSVAALGALILAASKFQHLVLPLFLGGALLVGAGRIGRKAAFAVLVGGLLGLAMHAGDALRAPVMARGIGIVNRADFVLTVLLPETGDHDRVATALKLEPDCLSYAGKSVYAMPGPAEHTCTHVLEWSRGDLWWLLVSDTPALAGALLHVPRLLLPWIPGLGLVENEVFKPLPPTIVSWNRAFGDHARVAAVLLLLPWIVFGFCLVRRAAPAARGFALMCAVGSASVPLVALFGDGDVEFAKHAQLTCNFALASLALVFAAVARRALVRAAP